MSTRKIFSSLILSSMLFSTNTVIAGDPIAAGDVFARDLNISGAGWVGHVGMYTGSLILEVLNVTGNVIQENTLSSFKKSSPYWGARYGNGYNFSTMISQGRAQKQFTPTYTTGASWIEGKKVTECLQWSGSVTCTKYRTILTPGKFRCDTLMNYIYWKGTGSFLISLMTPRNFYNSMPKAR